MAKGIKFGRKRTIDRDKVQALREQGIGATDIARQMKIGRATVYKILQSRQKRSKWDTEKLGQILSVRFRSIRLQTPRTADIFLAAGLSKEKLRPLAIKALKCMLLIRNIAPVSLNVVKRNVHFLEGGNYSEKVVNSLREESINISNYLELRDRVDRHLAEGSPHSEWILETSFCYC